MQGRHDPPAQILCRISLVHKRAWRKVVTDSAVNSVTVRRLTTARACKASAFRMPRQYGPTIMPPKTYPVIKGSLSICAAVPHNNRTGARRARTKKCTYA